MLLPWCQSAAVDVADAAAAAASSGCAGVGKMMERMMLEPRMKNDRGEVLHRRLLSPGLGALHQPFRPRPPPRVHSVGIGTDLVQRYRSEDCPVVSLELCETRDESPWRRGVPPGVPGCSFSLFAATPLAGAGARPGRL